LLPVKPPVQHCQRLSGGLSNRLFRQDLLDLRPRAGHAMSVSDTMRLRSTRRRLADATSSFQIGLFGSDRIRDSPSGEHSANAVSICPLLDYNLSWKYKPHV